MKSEARAVVAQALFQSACGVGQQVTVRGRWLVGQQLEQDLGFGKLMRAWGH